MSEEQAVLSEHAREEIDRWAAKYPPEQRRSAVLAALREVQHENGGWLTTELISCPLRLAILARENSSVHCVC